MKINALKLQLTLFCLFATPLKAADSTAPVFVDPTIQSYDGLSSRKLFATFFVDKVEDSRPNAPSDTLGVLHAGKNAVAPVIIKLHPSDVLKNSIQGMFRELSALSKERIDATYAVRAEVLLFELSETGSGMTHEIKAMFGFKVKIINVANNEVVRQSIITGEDSKKSSDTKKFAETVASTAVFNGVLRLLQNLSSLK